MRRGIAIAALICCSPAIAADLPPTYAPTLQEARQRLLEGEYTPLIQHWMQKREHHLSMLQPTFDEEKFRAARYRNGFPISDEIVEQTRELLKEMDEEHREAAAEASYQLGRIEEVLGRMQAARQHYRQAAELVDWNPVYAVKAGIMTEPPETATPPLWTGPLIAPAPPPTPQEPAPAIPTPTPSNAFDTGRTMAADWLTSMRTDKPPYMPWGIAAALGGIVVGVIDNAALKRRKWFKSVTFYAVVFGFVGMLAQTIYTHV